jgi:Protein of unknown function (DUF4038)
MISTRPRVVHLNDVNRERLPGPGQKPNLSLGLPSANPRYFSDDSGTPVYLTGSHSWADLVDLDTRYPPRRFDYQAYLDMLVRNGHNFIRLWTWEQPKLVQQSGTVEYADPLPWVRSGPGTANDGLPKFNLERFDPRYFDRLRARVVAARKRGIYVSIMLFEGWELRLTKLPVTWRSNPFNRDNNVNRIDGDVNGDGTGTEVHTLANPRVTAIQDRYVQKVVDTVYDLDNVLFEVANESGSDSTSWQHHMIDVVKQEEWTFGSDQPVGMTFQTGGDDATLFASPADWISPSGHASIKAPPPATGRKVVLLDTDHLCGVCGDATFIFKAFFRGYNPIYMDPITGNPKDEARYQAARRAMGETARLAHRIDLSVMTPHPELFSTGYGLAEPGATYLAYQPKRGRFSINLQSATGRLTAEWINPRTGSTLPGRTVTGGERLSLKPPLAGQSVLLLKKS